MSSSSLLHSSVVNEIHDVIDSLAHDVLVGMLSSPSGAPTGLLSSNQMISCGQLGQQRDSSLQITRAIQRELNNAIYNIEDAIQHEGQRQKPRPEASGIICTCCGCELMACFPQAYARCGCVSHAI